MESLSFEGSVLPCRGDALILADTAACVSLESKETFWAFSDILFSTQKELSESDVYGHIEQLGVDIENYKNCIESGKGRVLVEADMAEGKDLGVLWTPSFIINGRMFVGWPGERALEKLIEKELNNSIETD